MDANEDERAEECRQAREEEELQDVHGEDGEGGENGKGYEDGEGDEDGAGGEDGEGGADGEGGEGGEHPASAEAVIEEIARIVAAAEELFGGEEVLKHFVQGTRSIISTCCICAVCMTHACSILYSIHETCCNNATDVLFACRMSTSDEQRSWWQICWNGTWRRT